MRQVAVISGKGGTGKTSVCASLARLARPVVSADCDVDAANLALLQVGPDGIHEPYYHGRRVSVDLRRCIGCGGCEAICRFDAIRLGDTGLVFNDPFACSGCGACVAVCPEKVLGMHENIVGIWTSRPCHDGLLVHAMLGVAQENTGALVSKVRQRALEVAEDQGLDLILIDGPPGIGRPVQLSVEGADLILVVTEPSTSGEHDLRRVLELASEMEIPALVLVNKADLEPTVCARVEEMAAGAGAERVGRRPIDPAVPRALARGKLPLHVPGIAEPLAEVWAAIRQRLG